MSQMVTLTGDSNITHREGGEMEYFDSNIAYRDGERWNICLFFKFDLEYVSVKHAFVHMYLIENKGSVPSNFAQDCIVFTGT